MNVYDEIILTKNMISINHIEEEEQYNALLFLDEEKMKLTVKVNGSVITLEVDDYECSEIKDFLEHVIKLKEEVRNILPNLSIIIRYTHNFLKNRNGDDKWVEIFKTRFRIAE